jgi:acetyltransferase-like isoleucine patch superfamily enzyme
VRAKDKPAASMLRAVHANRQVAPDPPHEVALSRQLREQYGMEGLKDLYSRFAVGDGAFDTMMRRVVWRAIAKSFGNGVTIGPGVGFLHLETFEIGDGVFIGAQCYIQGRFDGTFRVGKMAWLGPHAYLDARNLIIDDYVGWGPGAKVLGSQHTGEPIGVPIIRTELEVKPVHVEAEADIGTNSTILPGVTIGKGSIVGAGAVVTADVEAYSVVAGVPARFVKWRKGYQPPRTGTREGHATSR